MTGEIIARHRRYPDPEAGDIVMCRFPYELGKPHPASKPRPAIVLRVRDPAEAGGVVVVEVCPGTKQIDRLQEWDLLIERKQHEVEYQLAGLSYDTKFDLSKIAPLEYTSEWFVIPERGSYGQTPKIGTVHPLTYRRMGMALKGAKQKAK